MNEPTITELLNQIELMKQALLFYSNKNIYGSHKDNASEIDLDMGHQARFVLEQIQKTSKYVKQIEKIIDEKVNIDKINKIDDAFLDKMVEINKIIDKYGNK